MNQKGFTLVELIATFAILGCLMIITGTAMFAFQNKFDKRYYQMLSDNISLAAKDYSSDHRGLTREGEVKIDISTMIQNGYMSDVLDKKQKNCSGYVLVKRKRLSYETKVCLICDNYKSEECDE